MRDPLLESDVDLPSIFDMPAQAIRAICADAHQEIDEMSEAGVPDGALVDTRQFLALSSLAAWNLEILAR